MFILILYPTDAACLIDILRPIRYTFLRYRDKATVAVQIETLLEKVDPSGPYYRVGGSSPDRFWIHFLREMRSSTLRMHSPLLIVSSLTGHESGPFCALPSSRSDGVPMSRITCSSPICVANGSFEKKVKHKSLVFCVMK